MTYPSQMPPQDRDFFVRVLEESTDCGYIKTPQNFQGRKVEEYRLVSHGPDCCLCCIGCGGRENDKTIVALSAAFFVFSFFVGLFYTAKSITHAAQANKDLKIAKAAADRIVETPPTHGFSAPRLPPFNPSSVPLYPVQDGNFFINPQPYPPDQPPPYFQPQIPQQYSPVSYQYANITQDIQSLYQDTVVILKGRVQEHRAVAVTQGLMTAGAGLITVALLITLIVEADLMTIGMGCGGAGLLAVGGILYVIKKGTLHTYEEQAAADRISQAIWPPMVS